MVWENEEMEAIAAANDGRAAFYRFLARLFFQELSQEQIEQLASLNGEGMGLSQSMTDGVRELSRALQPVSSGARQRLAADYAHVFLSAGTYKEKRAVPFESVFTSPDGLLMQDARDEVYAAFLREGLAAPKEELSFVPEDHIAYELEFMGNMAERVAAAARGGDAVESSRLAGVSSDFLENHLLNWIDDFADAVQRCSGTEFYPALVRLARAFLREDAATLGEMGAALAPVGASPNQEA